MSKAIVFCPGGMPGGAYMLGVLSLLFDKIKGFDGLSGNSIGSIVSAFVGQYPKGDEINSVVPMMRQFMTTSSTQLTESCPGKGFEGCGFLSTLNQCIDVNKVLQHNREICNGSFNIINGKYVKYNLEHSNKDFLNKSIVCSCTLPNCMYAKIVDDMQLIDGGYKNLIPIDNFRKKYDTYYVIFPINENIIHQDPDDPIDKLFYRKWRKELKRYQKLKRSKEYRNCRFVEIYATQKLKGDTLNTTIQDSLENFKIGLESVNKVLE